MEKKYKIGMLALLTIGLLGVGFVSAFPMGFGRFGEESTEEEIAEFQEKREAMKEAIENKDFDAWKTLMKERIEEMRSGITEENFQKISEMHQQRMEMKESCQNGEGECGFSGSRMKGKHFFGNTSEE